MPASVAPFHAVYPNPIPGAPFSSYRVRTSREFFEPDGSKAVESVTTLEDCADDAPNAAGPVHFTIYGIGEETVALCDLKTLRAALDVLRGMGVPVDRENVWMDPAAVLGAAMSLFNTAEKQAKKERLDISAIYNGGDAFMRACLTVAWRFEHWATGNADFDRCEDVWPYALQDRFGPLALAACGGPGSLYNLDETAFRTIADQILNP